MTYTTLAVGTPRKFSRLGFSGQQMSYPLGRLFGMLVGEQGSGKSYLFQSNPDAFILNLDESGIVHPNCQATIWPGVSKDGRSIDSDGKPIVLTWELVEAKRKQLIEMAKNNEDRPVTVVIDTLLAARRLLKPYTSTLLGRDFDSAHGPAAYEKMYETLIDFCMTLRQHGYGVWITAHLARNWIALGESQNVEEMTLSVSKGLKERLSCAVEIIAPMRCDITISTVEEEQKLMVNGKQIIRKVPRTTQEYRRSLVFDDPNYVRIVRTRTLRRMPNISLDGPEPWKDFEKAFTEANQPR